MMCLFIENGIVGCIYEFYDRTKGEDVKKKRSFNKI
jgi:hypothetical protein